MSEPLTSYAVDRRGRPAPPRPRPRPATRSTRAMLEEMLAHLAARAADDAVRVLVISSNDHMGLSAGADVREELDEEGRIRRMQLFADLYDELTGFPKPTVAACHGVVRRRRRRDRRRLRPAGRRLEPAPALPRRRARRPRRPGPPRHALRPLRRQVPAAHLARGRRRRGAAHGAGPPGRSRRRGPRRRRSSWPPRSPRTRPSRVARIKRMLHEWDGVVERSARRGPRPGRVAAHGPGLPHRD